MVSCGTSNSDETAKKYAPKYAHVDRVKAKSYNYKFGGGEKEV